MQSRKELSRRPALDPATKLPPELMVAVLQFLVFKDLLAVIPVSKHWCSLILETPLLWRSIDLTNNYKYSHRSTFDSRSHRPAFDIGTLEKYISRGKHQTAHIFLHGLWNYAAAVKLIFKICPHLESLGFGQDIAPYVIGNQGLYFGSGPYLFSTEWIPLFANLKILQFDKNCPIDLHNAQKILERCKLLKAAEFHRTRFTYERPYDIEFPNLRRLVLRTRRDLSDRSGLNLPSFVLQAPNLEELHIPGHLRSGLPSFLGLKYLRYLNLQSIGADVTVDDLLRMPSTIQKLAVVRLKLSRRNPFNFTELRSLWVKSLHAWSLPALTDVFQANLGGLREFSCGNFDIGYGEISENRQPLISFIETPGLFAGVTSLTLCGAVVTDETLQAVARTCPELTVANFSTTAMTSEGLKYLRSKPGKKFKSLKVPKMSKLRHDDRERTSYGPVTRHNDRPKPPFRV